MKIMSSFYFSQNNFNFLEAEHEHIYSYVLLFYYFVIIMTQFFQFILLKKIAKYCILL